MTAVIRRSSREACDACGESTAVTSDTLKPAGLFCFSCQLQGRLAMDVALRLHAREAALEVELRELRRQLRHVRSQGAFTA